MKKILKSTKIHCCRGVSQNVRKPTPFQVNIESCNYSSEKICLPIMTFSISFSVKKIYT